VAVRCRACDAPNAADARFCNQCGTRLRAPRAARGRGPVDRGLIGDRRIVTALFADLVDYSRLVAELDPEDVRARVDAALLAVDEAIAQYGGTREKFIGDALFAVFGYPVGHDDDALRAAHCALAIRAAIDALDVPDGSQPLQIRIGISTGEVVAAPRGAGIPADWSMTGPAVTIAARLQALAGPGEILLDEAALRLSRKALAVRDLGRELLRGQSRPVRLYELLGEATFQPWQPPSGRPIGRAAERALLREVLHRTRGTGVGAARIVLGDAGMGKSRLLADIAADARAAGFAWTWTENVSYGVGEPYRYVRALAQAIADEHGVDSGTMVRRLLFTAETPPEQVRRLAGAVAAVARDAAFSGWEEEASYVSPDPAATAAALLEVANRYVDRLLTEHGPRVIVIDDLHWLDRSSAGMVEQIVLSTQRLPLVVLMGSRPGALPAWATTEPVEQVALRGLEPVETEEMAAEVAGGAVDEADARDLHERTAGNPLFIGESVRSLLDDGDLPVRNGRLALRPSRPGRPPPMTLRALVGARIDALRPDAREALGVAAVIGIAFREPLVARVIGREVDPAVYDHLAEAALIAPLDGVDTWRFSHPLIHDTAYSSLLASRRRQLHGRIADVYEAGGAEDVVALTGRARQAGPTIGEIATHRGLSGDRARAVPLLVAAAESAIASGAAAEAAAFWRQAADLAPDPAEAEDLRALATAAGSSVEDVPVDVPADRAPAVDGDRETGVRNAG
jgi:adenylate cyclase